MLTRRNIRHTEHFLSQSNQRVILQHYPITSSGLVQPIHRLETWERELSFLHAPSPPQHRVSLWQSTNGYWVRIRNPWIASQLQSLVSDSGMMLASSSGIEDSEAMAELEIRRKRGRRTSVSESFHGLFYLLFIVFSTPPFLACIATSKQITDLKLTKIHAKVIQ